MPTAGGREVSQAMLGKLGPRRRPHPHASRRFMRRVWRTSSPAPPISSMALHARRRRSGSGAARQPGREFGRASTGPCGRVSTPTARMHAFSTTPQPGGGSARAHASTCGRTQYAQSSPSPAGHARPITSSSGSRHRCCASSCEACATCACSSSAHASCASSRSGRRLHRPPPWPEAWHPDSQRQEESQQPSPSLRGAHDRKQCRVAARRRQSTGGACLLTPHACASRAIGGSFRLSEGKHQPSMQTTRSKSTGAPGARWLAPRRPESTQHGPSGAPLASPVIATAARRNAAFIAPDPSRQKPAVGAPSPAGEAQAGLCRHSRGGKQAWRSGDHFAFSLRTKPLASKPVAFCHPCMTRVFEDGCQHHNL